MNTYPSAYKKAYLYQQSLQVCYSCQVIPSPQHSWGYHFHALKIHDTCRFSIVSKTDFCLKRPECPVELLDPSKK
jgi:hypothetical protein